REGRPLVSADAAALKVALDPRASWLAGDTPSVRIRRSERGASAGYVLDLLGRDGLVRAVDLETGALSTPAAVPAGESVRVEPSAPGDLPAGPGEVGIGEWMAPDLCIQGGGVPIHVRGSFP